MKRPTQPRECPTRAGAGIAALPDSMAGSDTELVPVLRETPLLSRDIWLVVHRDLKRSGSVRVVVWAIQGA